MDIAEEVVLDELTVLLLGCIDNSDQIGFRSKRGERKCLQICAQEIINMDLDMGTNIEDFFSIKHSKTGEEIVSV